MSLVTTCDKVSTRPEDCQTFLPAADSRGRIEIDCFQDVSDYKLEQMA